MAAEIRLDKWLWEMRLFKTRTAAAEACKRGRVMVEGVAQKASKVVRVGDVVQVRRSPVVFSFKIKAIAASRVGAKLVPEYMEQVTSEEQLQLWELLRLDRQNGRAKGLGRPTKRERRSLDEFMDEVPYFLEDEED